MCAKYLLKLWSSVTAFSEHVRQTLSCMNCVLNHKVKGWYEVFTSEYWRVYTLNVLLICVSQNGYFGSIWGIQTLLVVISTFVQKHIWQLCLPSSTYVPCVPSQQRPCWRVWFNKLKLGMRQQDCLRDKQLSTSVTPFWTTCPLALSQKRFQLLVTRIVTWQPLLENAQLLYLNFITISMVSCGIRYFEYTSDLDSPYFFGLLVCDAVLYGWHTRYAFFCFEVLNICWTIYIMFRWLFPCFVMRAMFISMGILMLGFCE